MGKGAIILGAIIILIGIGFLFVSIISAVIFIIMGLALIIFWNEENKIEQRKDLNKKKGK